MFMQSSGKTFLRRVRAPPRQPNYQGDPLSRALIPSGAFRARARALLGVDARALAESAPKWMANRDRALRNRTLTRIYM